MRIIAKAGNYEVTQDLNGVIAMSCGGGVHVWDKNSAYECIATVKDEALRKELLLQWATDIETCAKSVEQTKVVA